VDTRMNDAAGNRPVQRTKRNEFAKRATATMLGVAMLSGAGLAVAGSAQAVVSAQSRVGIDVPAGPQGSGTTWLGSMWLNNAGGQESWCIQWNTTEAPITIDPTAAEEANINYQITTYKNGSNLDQAAVAYNVHETMDSAANLQTLGYFLTGSAQGDAIKARAAQIQAEANANAGPYKVQPQLSIASDGRSGTVTATELVAASGAKLTGKTATAVLSGPGKFSNGSQTITFNTGDTLAFQATGNGVVNVTETVAGLPGTSVNVYTPPNSQAMITPGPATNAVGSSEDVTVKMNFQPVATSTAGTYVTAGAALTDTLHVKTSDGLAWLKDINGKAIPAVFDVDWYYSPTKLAPSAKAPAAAVLVTTGKGTANGVGDVVVTGLKTADKAGYYYPVAKFLKASQPDTLRFFFVADWSAGFNDPNEQTILKYTPKVVTKTAEIANGKINDVITVTGNNPDTKLEVVSTLVMTDAKTVAGGTATAPADAKTIATVTTSVTGNGTVKTGDADVPWPAIITKWGQGIESTNLYWQETIKATEDTNAWVGKHLLPAETVSVDKPTIVTQASPNGTVPLAAHDTGVLTGTVPSGTGVKVETMVDQYKFDNSTDGSAQAVCVNPSWSSDWQAVTKPGEITYPEHQVKFVGTFGYVETLKVSVTDNGKTTETVLHTGKCGEQNETVIGFPKDVPPTPEKPVLPNAPKPVTPAQPVAPKPAVVKAQASVVVPEVPAGTVASETGPNQGLIIGGSAIALASMALAGTMIVRRRKHAAELADTK
jgi:hypothetical protein